MTATDADIDQRLTRPELDTAVIGIDRATGVLWKLQADHVHTGQQVAVAFVHGALVTCDRGDQPAVYDAHTASYRRLTGRERAALVALRPEPHVPLYRDTQKAFSAIDRDPTEPEAVECEPVTSWSERDIDAVIDGLAAGTLTRPEPTIGARTDGARLFYAGRINSAFGPSGDGKTWVCFAIVAQELLAGRHVVWVDFEDDEYGAGSRLLALGLNPDTIKTYFHYITPNEPFSPTAEGDLLGVLTAHEPTVVVIDSQGEAMALDGVEDRDDKIARWTARVAKRIARAGPGVILIDHTPKDPKRDKLYAVGSQRKRAAVSGLAVAVEAAVEFGIGRVGRCHLTCAKDRGGHQVRGHRVADFTLDATTTPYTWTLELPVAPVGEAGDFQPTTLMEKVSRYVETHPGVSQREILDAVTGKAEAVAQAVKVLADHGRMTVESGPRNARLHTVTTPYRAEDGTL